MTPGEVVGFAVLEGEGHLDMPFVCKDAVGCGVGGGPARRSSGRRRSARTRTPTTADRAVPISYDAGSTSVSSACTTSLSSKVGMGVHVYRLTTFFLPGTGLVTW